MSARLTCIASLVLLAAVASAAYGEEPAAKARQFILTVRYCEGVPYRNDHAAMNDEKAIHDQEAKGVLRVLAEPDLMLSENRKAHFIVDGEIITMTKAAKVQYGTIIDAWAKGKKDGRIQLDFVTEYSTAAYPESSDFGDEVRTLPTEKVFGSVTMKPGVVYRVFSRTSGPSKSWWEFKIQDVK